VLTLILSSLTLKSILEEMVIVLFVVFVVNVILSPCIKVISSAVDWLAVKSAAVTAVAFPTFVFTENVPLFAALGIVGLLRI